MGYFRDVEYSLDVCSIIEKTIIIVCNRLNLQSNRLIQQSNRLDYLSNRLKCSLFTIEHLNKKEVID